MFTCAQVFAAVAVVLALDGIGDAAHLNLIESVDEATTSTTGATRDGAMVTSTEVATSLTVDGQAMGKFWPGLKQILPRTDPIPGWSPLLCNRTLPSKKRKLLVAGEYGAMDDFAASTSNAEPYLHCMMPRRSLSGMNGLNGDVVNLTQIEANLDDRPDVLKCIDAAIVMMLMKPAAHEYLMLIAARWWRQLRSYYSRDGSHPGPIQNLALMGRAEPDSLVRNDDGGCNPLRVDMVNDAGDIDTCRDAPVCKRLHPFDDNIVLVPGLRKDIDYVIVPDHVWRFLIQRFGGDHTIRRPIAIEPRVVGAPIVDVVLHPVSIMVRRVDRAPDASLQIVLVCSPLDTVLDAKRAVCGIYTATVSEIRAVKPSGHSLEAISPTLRLCDVGLAQGGTMFVERRTTNGMWSCAKALSTPTPVALDPCCACFDRVPVRFVHGASHRTRRCCSLRCQQIFKGWYERWHHRLEEADGRGYTPGTSGLVNIGNSCYINAALQCLSCVYDLTHAFLSNHFVQELNCDNPLGTQGRLAHAYADLLKDMWLKDGLYANPSEFKRAMAGFASQFAGCDQQDAQEFLAFLLDGIHEDLNRVRRKSYTPATDSRGRPDEIVALEQWTSYLGRNQSIVVDSFLGQFKSEVVCAANPDCPASATFDPFMSVSLPLPESVHIVPVVYHPVSGRVPTQLFIRVSRVSVTSMEVALLPVLRARPDYTPGNGLIFAQGALYRPLTILPKNSEPIEVSAWRPLGVYEIRPESVPVSCITSDFLFPFVVDLRTDQCQPVLSGQHVYRRIAEFLARAMFDPDVEPRFRVVMDTGNDWTTDIRKTDAPVDFHSTTVPVFVIVYDDSDVEFDVHKLMRVDQTDATPLAQPIAPTSIYDCFSTFTRMESLDVGDWTCTSCHTKGASRKRLNLWRLPDVLILHLKRFDSVQGNADSGRSASKISVNVDFPLIDLDLTPFLSTAQDHPIPLYELFGVINHHGDSFFGHYTAFTKGLDGVWRHFDDESVQEVSPTRICQSSAYVLFYRRQSD